MIQPKSAKTAPTEEIPPTQKSESSSARNCPPLTSLAATSATAPVLDSQNTQAYAPDPETQPQNAPPSIPGYEIQEVLGRGGMGVVYKAYQPGLNRLVALKMILAGAHAAPQELERFRREAQAVARLQHPNIVQIHEVGEQDGLPFFSLEFLEGGSLAAKLTATPLPVRQAAVLAEVLARAVQHAHAHGIVHRDLKPANILLTADGTPKVADFGLAKLMEEETGQTQTGAVVGTPSYMAPEQANTQAGTIGPATDVYALGAMLYDMLTGRPPFRAATHLDTVLQVISQEPVPTTRLQPKVPRDLDTICMKCLQKEPGRRYATAEALAEDLRRFLAGEPIMARPAGLAERAVKWARRRPAVAALLALIVLVAATGFGLVTWQWLEAEAARNQAEQAGQAEAAQRRHAESAKEKAVAAKQQAEAAQKDAETAKQDAETARHKAEEQKRRFQRLSATLLLEKGQNLCDQEDLGRGLLWLARSLQLAPTDDADLQRVIRINLADWQRQFYPLRAVFSHGRRIDAIALSPDGKTVLTGSTNWSARLWDAATGQPRAKPLNHKGHVLAVAFSPEGHSVLTGSADNTARLWNAKTGMPQGKTLQHKGSVLVVVFSPDGKTVLTGSADKTARLWNAATGAPLGEPLRHEGEVRAVAFSPDGKKVLTGSLDKTGRLWDAATGKPIGAPLQHNKAVVAVAFSLKGKPLAATASEDATARLWNAVSGKPHMEPLTHGGTVTALAFSPNSALLLTGSTDQMAHVWSVSTGKRFGQLKHEAPVSTVAVSPDGETLLTGSLDQTVRLWNRANQKPLGPPLPHQSEVMTALFGPEGKTVLTATKERTARLWDVARRPSSDLALVGHDAECLATAFSPDGKLVLTGSVDGTARLWDAATGKPFGKPFQHQDWVVAVAFSSDGKRALTGSRDKTARLWEVATGNPIGQPLQHDGTVLAVSFSPDGQTAVTTSTDATARLWETATGKAIGQPLRHRGTVRAAAFSPDGKTVVTASADSTAQLWDAATGKALNVILKHQSEVFAAAFSPDGKMVATGSNDETAQLWEAATGKPTGELKHQGAVLAVAFSPDGKLLLTASEDRTARLWDGATGKPAYPPLTHQRGVRAIAFSPDGKTILTGSRDGTARFWDVASGRPLGVPLKHHFREVRAVAFSPDGKRVVTAGEQKATRLWPVPVPVAGEVERLVLWIQVLTGMELDADGAVGALDAARWYERRQRLGELGGPPLP